MTWGIAISVPVCYATDSQLRGALCTQLCAVQPPAEPPIALLAFFLLRASSPRCSSTDYRDHHRAL